ncbi:hypothetical protein [Cellulomonas fimi]|uniref:hypothetical protein n=1 Tax=Cellulomonas fimi TaxID=1708 RepID=UPI0023596321|nr:hypothetical protein [Cellulomonas fimi]
MTAPIRWKAVRSAEEAEAALRARLPLGTSLTDARVITSDAGLECSDGSDGLMTCRAQGRGRVPWVSVSWLAELTFVDDHLTAVQVRQGLTGP